MERALQPQQYNLLIHFGIDQDKHEINSDSLVTFIEAYKDIAKAFGLNAEIKIGVPEEGGWKGFFQVTLLPLMIAYGTPLLTNNSLDDWGKKSHAYAMESINSFITEKETDISKDISEIVPPECIVYKNKIYRQFQKDEAIGSFSLDNCKPIPKGDFPLYIKEPTN